MSYSFNTGRVETSPVQNDSGSVSVAILHHSADSQTKTRSESSSADLALAPQPLHVIVVWAGGTSTTFRPARWAHSISIALLAPMAPSADVRAIRDLAKNRGLKSSIANNP